MSLSFWRVVQATVAICVVTAANSGSAFAFGALAFGEPSNVSKEGIAIGDGVNYATKEGAEARAMKECLSFKGAPVATRSLCKVVITFEKQCFAIALDPKNGTPGWGWAMKKETAEAETFAIDQCRKTAGPSRVNFCKVTLSHCDETNSQSP